MRDGLSRGLLETIFALAGVALVIGDSLAPTLVDNGFAAGMALVGASGTSFALRYTRPGTDDEEHP